MYINCVKKIGSKCLKFNEPIEIVSQRKPVYYDTTNDSYLVKVRNLLVKSSL